MQPEAAPAPALAFAGVSVPVPGARSGPPWLLRDVDWVVEPGEHWVVLGPNGAGKTTLLQTAAGRLEPAAGDVRVLGERHGAHGYADPRLRIAEVHARPRLFAQRLTATEVAVLRAAGPVALRGNRIPPEDFERARELLTLFGCDAVRDRPFGECSEGERQRVLLARALMRDPALLLLDEPTAALDLPGREDLLAAMERLARQRPGLTTIAITHHVEDIPPSTTHAALLRAGAILTTGAVEAVVTGDALSACFDMPIGVTRVGDRWFARAGEASDAPAQAR